MPKVVKEGKSKKTAKPKTPNPRTPKAIGPNDTPTGKRKYVRKKGLDNPPDSPSVDAISIITESKTESKTLLCTRRSCRKSLNFDFESQVGDESSNQPDFGSESHAQNFSTCIQTSVQLGHETKGIIGKEQVGFAYDITLSTNKEVENYISMPDKQAQSPLTLSKTDQARDKLMADVQTECTRGKCRIVFSNVTHDKESSILQILDSNSHSVPRSPNDSNCSTTECLTKEKQARGVKRGHGSATGKELCNINAIGAHHNSMQAYMAMFPVYQYGDDRIPGMYFPPIYKRKRTEKCHNSAASITMPTVTAAQSSAKQSMEHPLKGTRGYPFTSETNCTSLAAQFNGTNAPIKTSEGAQDRPLSFRCMLALSTTETKKKRSKGITRVRDLASLIEIVEGMQLPNFPTRGATSTGISHQPHSCMEALVADTHAATATKKRTKRNSLANSWTPGPYPGIAQKDMFPIDALVEHLKHLDINEERKQVAYSKLNALSFYQDQNALVVYRRDRTLVPFEGPFNPIKKRRPRPRVDLDDETTRVWKLLLQDINSEGINGTDEKEKWWEEERRVFSGRADSFIARMHLIQGDRRFSKWKGSVVDSVVGVFLTQNVSDHLSSSAFMTLAARFPLVSNNGPASEERMNISSVNEPETCVLDPDDTIEWHGVKSNQPTCGRISMKLRDVGYNEEREFDNSNESSVSSTDGVRPKDGSNFQLDFASYGLGMYQESALNRSTTMITGTMSSFNGDQKEMDDVISSQNSVISSQNSMDSSIAEVAERSFSHTNLEAEPIVVSRPNSFAGTTSFVELLRMAETTNCNGFYNPEVSSRKKIESNQFKITACDLRKQDDDRSDGSKALLGPLIPSGNELLHLTPNSKEVECIDMLGEVSKSSGILEEDKYFFPIEESRSSTESASQATVQHIVAMDSHEASKSSAENYLPHNSLQVESNKAYQSQTMSEDPKNKVRLPTQEKICQVEKSSVPNFSVPLDVTRVLDNSRTKGLKEIKSNSNDNACLPQKNFNGLNATTSKAKRGRMGKEKQIAVEWDSLRKQAQVNGERERTANTMDSVDWEAVRLADVEVVAYTIRERGMNNMLAERIKAFLDRLVRDHGSIDLEWLRDVPPDKAKEYLLSFRGLGLKSVECVRLLTLHHLAFPVDTNVGRIAVRLGWVPLQPLPESLQLHLLEMYPVLESIQKYLWPRLCKLDQRTLYELHYQMITFGKVFCTKSKPNCNACPMRGECRHFASAFASARLALPAPEEKSLVTTENNAVNQSPVGIIKRLQLPVSQTNQQQEAQSDVSICEPIIEVPASPEPIIEVPATPEPERKRNLENDIEDIFGEDPEEIPTIKLNIEEFTQTLQEYMHNNMELQECDVSKALVALTPEAASIPTVKLKNVSRLRTEHQVYELPDSHPLLEGLAAREPDDPCKYLLAIWTPGETADSIQPPIGQCSCQESGNLCNDHTCYACSSLREANSQTVRGTLLIPCRTAMRGSFPLNGTYFQVNEVFADHESSLNPIDVPRSWIWNLPRKTVFFGTSIPTIFKGLSTQGIQFCFWKGFVCVRGFDQNTRAPRPLMARLHFPASKLARGKEKINE